MPDQTFAGTVVFVSPVSNPNSNTFPVKVKVDNKDGLLFAGMVAEVSLDSAQDGRLELPKSAVVQKDGKEFVFTVNNGTARLVNHHGTEERKLGLRAGERQGEEQ